MKKKIVIAILSVLCVFSAFFAIGFEPTKNSVKAAEITFSSTNYYQGITTVNERFTTLETTFNLPAGASTRGCIIGNYPESSLSFNSDFFSLETTAAGTLRYFFRLSTTNGNSECTFNYDFRGKGDVTVTITHTRSTGAVSAKIVTSSETVTKTGTVSTALETSPVPNSLPLCVGNDYRKTTCPFPGTIKKVSMKNASGNLILSYNLQGKGGATDIKDESGNGHHLKLAKADTITLSQTNGISFNTAGTMLQTNNVINDNINGIETWINVPTNVADTVRPGVIWGNYSTVDSKQNNISFEITTNGNPRFFARYNSSDHKTSVVFSDVDVRTGQNLHLSIFFDRSAQKGYCYVNGVLKQIVNVSVTNKLDNSDCIDIVDRYGVGGDFRNSSGQPPEQSRFKGTIYSLAVFSYGRPATSLAVNASAPQIVSDMTNIPLNLQGLVALYDFNGKQNNEYIKDLSGNGNHLVSYTIGKTSPAFLEDYVYTSTKSVTVPINTVEAWINMPKTYSGRGGVIIGNYCDTQGITDAFSFEITDDGRPRLYTRYNNGDDSRLDIKFAFDVRTAEDMHLAVTLNRTNKTATLYVNGRIPDGCLNVPFTYAVGYNREYESDVLPGDLPMCVGNDHRNTKANSYFRGTIYSVAIYSDIRTQAEVISDLEKINTSDANIILAYNLKNLGTTVSSISDITKNGYDLSADSVYINWESNTTYQQTKKVASAPKTLEATIKLPASYTARAGVITGTYGGSADAFGLEIYTNGNPRLFITDTDSNTTNVDIKFTSVNVATGAWVHLAVVINGSTATLYINGTSKATGTITTSSSYVPTFPFGVGGDLRSGNSEYFKGLIKNVAVYSDVRTATEIASDATATSIDTSSLLFGYNLKGVANASTIQDLSSNDNDLNKAQYWIMDDSITDPTNFDYSFAVVGDTQKVNINNPENFSKIYKYITDNAKSKKIAHVFGLGDITDANLDEEYVRAATAYKSLEDAGIPYSLVRGNHDGIAQFAKYFGSNPTTKINNYASQYSEYYIDTYNSIHYFSAGKLDYMVVTLDYGASDAVLNWAKTKILANPHRNAIITTHAYWFRDGTSLDSDDIVPPSKDLNSVYDKNNVNNGDNMWNELVSQCPNIVFAISGHDPCDNVVYTPLKGVNGNTVTNMLIDPQSLDESFKTEGGIGAVAMFYFSNGGKTVEIRFWSTIKNCYIKTSNNTIKFDVNTIARPTVTWKNGDTTLETDSNHVTNTKPSYNGSTPTKAKTAEYTYTFAGWSTSKTGTATIMANLPTVTANTTYYAIFNATKNKYNITWKNHDGTTLKTESLEYGATPSYSGTAPTKTATAEYTYTFKGWTPTIASVTGPATYTATFTETVNKYTITWKDYDGSTLKSESLEYGATPSYGTNPTRPATAEYTYTFKGWTPTIASVTKDATYTATFNQTVNTYTIKFIVNGQIKQEETLAYGTTISYKGTTPTKEPTSQYTYSFNGWSLTENGEVIDNLGTVSGNKTLYAIFTPTEIPVSSSSSSAPSSSKVESSSSIIESSSSSVAPSSSSKTESSSSSSKEESSISSAISSSNGQSSNKTSSSPSARPTTIGCGANLSSTYSMIAILLVIASIIIIITKKKHN